MEGKVQIHGYVESVMRAIQDDFNSDNKLDLTQWYNVLNLEFEFDIAPDGFGPFDLVSGFVRVEARYDCVWTRACGTMRSADTYGNRAKRLPERSSDAHKNGVIGVRQAGAYSDTRPYIDIPYDMRGDEWAVPFTLGGLASNPPEKVPGQRNLGRIWHVPGLGELFFGAAGNNGFFDDPDVPIDDPGLYVMDEFLEFNFGLAKMDGSTYGNGVQVLGPYRPANHVSNAGALRNKANPYDPNAVNPFLKDPDTGEPLVGAGVLPFRPAPLYPYAAQDAPIDQAQGLYYPSAGFKDYVKKSRFGAKDVNYSQSELEWNHGASQQDEGELKEAYLDIDMFDHQLWLRVGKQTIVWGKTELFRNQDQFNPQDLGLTSLPSLEESRIGLWAGRAIWSFYNVGPLEDVRLEGAVNFDEFEPTDLGSCGEPYAPPAACTKKFGLFAHSLTGTALAGERRPPNPWNDIEGLEGGLRLEFRWERFAFAITDFYGYDDLPYLEQIFVFQRNVDPMTGRPRPTDVTLPCDPEGVYTPGIVAGCLGNLAGTDEPQDDQATRLDVLANHHANQQLFATICGATVTFSAILPSGCGFNVWNSIEIAIPEQAALSPRLSTSFTSMLAGQGYAERGGFANYIPCFTLNLAVCSGVNGKTVLAGLADYQGRTGAVTTIDSALALMIPPDNDEDDMPLVPLTADPNDDGPLTRPELLARQPDLTVPEQNTWLGWATVGVQPYLTDEQEALLGCGQFWGTECDVDGFDLLNADASVIFQSWPGIEGTEGDGMWDTNDDFVAQPGTIPFYLGDDYDPIVADANAPGGTRYAPYEAYAPEQRYGAQPYVCTRYLDGKTIFLPGCLDGNADIRYAQNPQTLPSGTPPPGAPPLVWPAFNVSGHPFACDIDPTTGQCYFDDINGNQVKDPGEGDLGQPWASELAALSWNMLMTFVSISLPADLDGNGEFDADPRFDEFDPQRPFRLDGCSYYTPLVCKASAAIIFVSAAGRNDVRAGGNERFGRRDFVWHAGSEVVLKYHKRNTLGFAMDFAEDVTKSNWSIEFTWFDGVKMANNDDFDGLSTVDQYNLTVSVDRPTFIRFLNPARTFFFNSQVFLQYIDDYKQGFVANGPYNLILTASVGTGYFQDRLVPSFTAVWDRKSGSGALLPQLTYRITQNFSMQIGAGVFFGRTQRRTSPLVPVGTPTNGAGKGSYHSYADLGLSSIRDRDELYLQLRYTF